MSCLPNQTHTICDQQGTTPFPAQAGKVPFDCLDAQIVPLASLLAEYDTLKAYARKVMADLKRDYQDFPPIVDAYTSSPNAVREESEDRYLKARSKLVAILRADTGFCQDDIAADHFSRTQEEPLRAALWNTALSAIFVLANHIQMWSDDTPILKFVADWIDSWPPEYRNALVGQGGYIKVCGPTLETHEGVAWHLEHGQPVPADKIIFYPDLIARYGV